MTIKKQNISIWLIRFKSILFMVKLFNKYRLYYLCTYKILIFNITNLVIIKGNVIYKKSIFKELS